MSRWLANVNNLLEKLDGTVEEVIEEQQLDNDVDDLDSILAKRGLAEDDMDNQTEFEVEPLDTDPIRVKEEVNVDDNQIVPDGEDFQETILNEENKPEPEPNDERKPEHDQSSFEESSKPDPTVKELVTDDSAISKAENSVIEKDDEDIDAKSSTSKIERESGNTNEPSLPQSVEVQPAMKKTHQNALTNTAKTLEEPNNQAHADAHKLQRELRTLRRHVVSLNKQLETAETELEAQRVELSQAGNRLETNRKKAKDEKEKQIKMHDSQIKTLTQEKDKLLSEIKERHHKQLEELQQKLRESDEKRMQEGGDWTKELENTIQRERDLVKKLAFTEDEKATLLSQISTLQSQHDRLQGRMDSISQTADNAMMREREAEDKLDMALSMHARQLSQRQARETDLERTIAELSTSLASSKSPMQYDNLEGDTAAGLDNSIQLRTQVNSLEEELESLKSQLVSEKQRVVIMQHELRDMSKERTLEATMARSKQHQFDRQIADMSLQISKLQSNLREANKLEGGNSGISHGESRQLTELTEQVVRNQEKMGQATSEISALKNRLKVAVARAEKAEKTLERVENEGDIESGNYTASLSAPNSLIRRRKKKDEISIRAAINLSSSRSQNTERIGKAVDTLDNFSVQTGKYLRRNPLARGGFILYLIMLHTWTFVVLFFHAHRFETIHGDFGAGHLAHGPHMLMQQTKPVNLDASMLEKDVSRIGFEKELQSDSVQKNSVEEPIPVLDNKDEHTRSTVDQEEERGNLKGTVNKIQQEPKEKESAEENISGRQDEDTNDEDQEKEKENVETRSGENTGILKGS